MPGSRSLLVWSTSIDSAAVTAETVALTTALTAALTLQATSPL